MYMLKPPSESRESIHGQQRLASESRLNVEGVGPDDVVRPVFARLLVCSSSRATAKRMCEGSPTRDAAT